jgi:glycerol-3-phosphate O-acyltransferase/dihydroxyacetone phosphate acyltransferase
MRHVLRARAEAVRALAAFFEQLEKEDNEKHVRASAHLARVYGGWVDEAKEQQATLEGAEPTVGWRSAKEVAGFLRKRGAKIPTLVRSVCIEGEWAALSSEGEGSPAYEDSDAGLERDDSAVWVSAE